MEEFRKLCKNIPRITSRMSDDELNDASKKMAIAWDMYQKLDKELNSRGKRYQDQENTLVPDTHPTGYQVLFVTLTLTDHQDSESMQQQVLRDRIRRIVSQRSYPIVQWYGVLAHTEKGMLHAHLMLVHKLKRSNGKYQYLKPSFLRNMNQGDFVDKKNVNSLLGAQYVANYMRNQEHDSQETLIFLNEEIKFFEYIEINKCRLWVDQENGGCVKENRD